MVDLVLIQPPVHLKRTELGANIVSPNIGLAYIAAYCLEQRHSVAVIDAHAENLGLDDIAFRIRELQPSLIGISAMTYQLLQAAETASMLKREFPTVPIVLGGCHATELPRLTLEQFPMFDAAVIGEGELVAHELLEAYQGRGDLRSIAGLVLRDGETIIENPPRPPIKNLDALPYPAYSLFPLDSYKPFYSRKKIVELPLSSSRGCPFECVFCAKAMGNQVRHRSSESLAAEVRFYRETYGVQQIIFTDENFTINRRLVISFCEEIIESRLTDINFICQSRVAVDREMLHAMAQAGFSHITFGIEAGSQQILTSAKKQISLLQSRAAVAWAKAEGMIVDGNFILGLPYETRATIHKTIAFACSLPLDYASFFLLVPYPGTEVARMAKTGEGNLVLVSEDWAMFGKQIGGALRLANIDRKQLERLQLYAYFRFYGSPRRFLLALKKVTVATIARFLWFQLKNAWPFNVPLIP